MESEAEIGTESIQFSTSTFFIYVHIYTDTQKWVVENLEMYCPEINSETRGNVHNMKVEKV